MPVQLSVRTEVVVPISRQVPATFYSFNGFPVGQEHFLVALGPVEGQEAPLVRVHSECITGDLFGSQRCDCGPQLHEAIARLQEEGGYLAYLRQEGRGIGLYAKLDAYVLQDQGLNTFEANRHLDYPDDLRDYEAAAAMLREIGVKRVRLLTNNPEKISQLRDYGVDVASVVPTGVFINNVNARYLESKVTHTRHTLHFGDDGGTIAGRISA